MFNIFKKKVEEKVIEQNIVEEKAITPLAVNKHNIETITQETWNDKKEMTQEDMLTQYKSWSFICARLNGESVASQKLRLYARTAPNQKRIKNFTAKEVDRKTFKSIIKSIPNTKPVDIIEEIYDHPVLDLIYNVNPYSNYFDNMQLLQTYMDLCGNAYLFVVMDRDGMPSELYQMRPDMTKVVPGKSNLINGYIYGNKDKSALKYDEVIRFNVPNPSNPFYGKSCIEAAYAEVSRNNLYNRYENSILQNNGRPDFIVDYETGQLTAEDRKRLTLEWNRLYSGVQNAGKVAIMDSNFKIVPLSFKPEEMQYLEGRSMTKRDLSSVFGVPYALLDTSEQMKAGLDQLVYHYQRYGILPRLRRIEEALNEQLIPFYDNTGDLFFKFDNPVDDDRKQDAEINTKYVQAGILSVNEAREAIGYDSVEGGDDLKVSKPSVKPVEENTNEG